MFKLCFVGSKTHTESKKALHMSLTVTSSCKLVGAVFIWTKNISVLDGTGIRLGCIHEFIGSYKDLTLDTMITLLGSKLTNITGYIFSPT